MGKLLTQVPHCLEYGFKPKMLKEGVNFAFGEIGWIIWKELCKKFAEIGLIKFLIQYFPEPYGKIQIDIMNLW